MAEIGLGNNTSTKKSNVTTYIVIAVILALMAGIAFFAVRNGKLSNDLYDTKEEIAELQNYKDKVTKDDKFFVNEVIRVSGTERIYRALQMYDTSMYNDLRSKFVGSQPISYQNIVITQKRIDTLYKTLIVRIDTNTAVIPIKIVQGLVKVNGNVTYYSKKDSAIIDLKIEKDPTKIIVIILEDEKTHELKASVQSNDPDMVISSLDTRIMKNYSVQKPLNFVIGGGITFRTNFASWNLNLTTGIEFTKQNFGILAQTHLFDSHLIEQISLVIYTKF